MDGYKHFIRVDANNIVIHAFSDAFEQPMGTDILIESSAGRHYNPTLTDGQGNFISKWNGTQLVDRTQDEDYLLSVAKQNKLAELTAKCTASLATFVSAALGTSHTYLSGQLDMLLIEAEDRYMNSTDYDGLPVLWYTLENSDVNHTKAQMHQVYLDARNNVQTVKYKMKNLAGQVQSAITAADVNAIVW